MELIYDSNITIACLSIIVQCVTRVTRTDETTDSVDTQLTTLTTGTFINVCTETSQQHKIIYFINAHTLAFVSLTLITYILCQQAS